MRTSRKDRGAVGCSAINTVSVRWAGHVVDMDEKGSVAHRAQSLEPTAGIPAGTSYEFKNLLGMWRRRRTRRLIPQLGRRTRRTGEVTLPAIGSEDSADIVDVRFEDFTAMTMKNGVFWDVTPCGSCKNRRFGET
jgi:hypothetical protein